jgi:hypothetical protein
VGHAGVAFSRGGGGGGYTAGRSYGGSRPSFAYGGSSSYGYRGSTSYARGYSGYSGNSRYSGYSRGGYGGGRSHYSYAFGSRSGWNPGHEYYWNGHHYRWYGNGWFIIDPYPYGYYGSDDYAYSPAYTVYGSAGPDDSDDSAGNSGNIDVRVQQELARDGYYHGPIDGIVGPGTRAAIEAYQQDNGLHPTGTINSHLLDAMDLD